MLLSLSSIAQEQRFRIQGRDSITLCKVRASRIGRMAPDLTPVFAEVSAENMPFTFLLLAANPVEMICLPTTVLEIISRSSSASLVNAPINFSLGKVFIFARKLIPLSSRVFLCSSTLNLEYSSLTGGSIGGSGFRSFFLHDTRAPKRSAEI